MYIHNTKIVLNLEDFRYIIREIKPEDNSHICKVIRDVFIDFDLPLVGTAYADNETNNMYESYLNENEQYFVVEFHGKVLGGAGIKSLKNGNKDVCELQKMYFSNKIRGKGLGVKMLQKCLAFAKKSNYKVCYLETIKSLTSAIHLYHKFGFKSIDGPLGNTNHFSCDIHMTKNL